MGRKQAKKPKREAIPSDETSIDERVGTAFERFEPSAFVIYATRNLQIKVRSTVTPPGPTLGRKSSPNLAGQLPKPLKT